MKCVTVWDLLPVYSAIYPYNTDTQRAECMYGALSSTHSNGLAPVCPVIAGEMDSNTAS